MVGFWELYQRNDMEKMGDYPPFLLQILTCKQDFASINRIGFFWGWPSRNCEVRLHSHPLGIWRHWQMVEKANKNLCEPSDSGDFGGFIIHVAYDLCKVTSYYKSFCQCSGTPSTSWVV